MKIISQNQFLKLVNTAPSKFDILYFKFKQDIALYAIQVFDSAFEEQRLSGGNSGSWAVRKKDYPWKPLQKTGALRGSITFRLMADRVRIETRNKYSQYHNDPNNKPVGDANHTYSNFHGAWKVNQYSNELAKQRQFMGHSKLIDRYVQRRLESMMSKIYEFGNF